MGKNFIQEFDKYKNKILSKENFAYARYADGEVKLMNGMSVGHNTQAYQADGWSCESKMYKLGENLLQSLNHVESNYYYAITSPNQSMFDYVFLMDRIKQLDSNITFADLWINGNYQRFKNFLLHELKESVVLVASKDGLHRNTYPLVTKEFYPIPNDCVNFYELNHDTFTKDMINLSAKYENTLFFISAGPLSEVIIHDMYESNPNNRYIDVGSAVDEIVHGVKTRPYMVEETIYSRDIVQWTT